ncbi:MAG: rod shape-determining protein MreC [Candidatus Liptonbacteria bacterium]|nr:rod shape-determining protein MreC [Candidatus Liptonbacteria bacterium]
MRLRWSIIIACILILGSLIVYPELGWRVRAYFEGRAAPDETLTDLQIENELLRAELDQAAENVTPKPVKDAIRAAVYARYPFGFRGQILIARGARDGVQEGQAVVAPLSTAQWTTDGLLIGKVAQVFSDTALVITLRDPSWRSAVRVGPDGAEALLVGGLGSKLAYIPKDALVLPGDSVVNADPILPYGLAIGEVEEVQPAGDQIFQEATITLRTDTLPLRSVLVIPGHEIPSRDK